MIDSRFAGDNKVGKDLSTESQCIINFITECIDLGSNF